MRTVSPNVVFEIVLYDLGQYGKILLVEFTCAIGLNPSNLLIAPKLLGFLP